MKDSGSYANPINSSFQKFRTTSWAGPFPGRLVLECGPNRCRYATVSNSGGNWDLNPWTRRIAAGRHR